MSSELLELARFFINVPTIAVSAGLFALFRALNKTQPKGRNWYWRLLPVMPHCLGALLFVAFDLPLRTPSWATFSTRADFAIRFMLGLWCGFFSAWVLKFLTQSVLGMDERISLPPKVVALIKHTTSDLPIVRDSVDPVPNERETEPVP